MVAHHLSRASPKPCHSESRPRHSASPCSLSPESRSSNSIPCSCLATPDSRRHTMIPALHMHLPSSDTMMHTVERYAPPALRLVAAPMMHLLHMYAPPISAPPWLRYLLVIGKHPSAPAMIPLIPMYHLLIYRVSDISCRETSLVAPCRAQSRVNTSCLPRRSLPRSLPGSKSGAFGVVNTVLTR